MAADVELRDVTAADIAVFFEQQMDAAARQMAAFTVKDAADRTAFDAHWARILADDETAKRTVLFGGRVAGSVASFEQTDQPGGAECPNCAEHHESATGGGPLRMREVTYWIGREFWGQGVATRALSMFLEEIASRPLIARAAKDNVASIRVLEKCGFRVIGHERGFANARGEDIDEVVLMLAAETRGASGGQS